MFGSVMSRATSRKSRPIRGALIVGACLALVMPASVLGAGKPVHVHRDVFFEFQLGLLTAACGYPVFNRFEGTVNIVVHYDAEGRTDREVDAGKAVRTVFAPSTGRALSWPIHFNSSADYEPDGSGIATVTGLAVNAHAPGLGQLQHLAGHEVWAIQIVEIDDEGVPFADFVELLESHGSNFGSLPEICAALDA
jgi:hypothetical protein